MTGVQIAPVPPVEKFKRIELSFRDFTFMNVRRGFAELCGQFALCQTSVGAPLPEHGGESSIPDGMN